MYKKSRQSTNYSLPTSARHRWILATVMLTVLAFGWRFPLLGFIVPVAMLSGMLGGIIRGRYVCGNLCPRGSFFDTFFAKFGPQRPIPQKLFAMPFRGLILVGLMGFMTFRLAQNPGSIEHWGLVFWQMCLLTTAAAMVLGVLYRPRTWCAICPVGTIGNATGGGTYQLTISEDCRSCNRCVTSCPLGLQIADSKEQGFLRERDCLQCSTCVNVCPTAALTLEKVGQYRPLKAAKNKEIFKKAA